MTRQIEFHPAAQAEAIAAFGWYLERNGHAAQEFMTELDRVIKGIVENPQLFPKVGQETRRAVLKRFPYVVVFRDIESRVEIVAVAHGRRRPAYWKMRSS